MQRGLRGRVGMLCATVLVMVRDLSEINMQQRYNLREIEEEEETVQFIEQLHFNEQGLIPAIVQDAETGEVLMMAWMNREALQRTIETGKATYWSRSRQKFWVKGETSGHFQEVQGVYIDCDADTVLLKVRQVGAACHEGYRSCFFRQVDADGENLQVVADRLVNPDEVYSR